MKDKDNKKEYKLCAIFHSISSVAFTFSGVLSVVNNGFNDWTCITNFALGITFGSLAYMYFQKYKKLK